MSRHSTHRRASLAAASLLAAAAIGLASAGTAVAAEAGDTVYIGSTTHGYAGTTLFEIHLDSPGTGTPAFFAYCIEHEISPRTGTPAVVGDFSDFLGDNKLTDSVAQAKVRWVLAHSYPVLSLADFGAAAGVPGISLNDAVEATQYAIWRFSELDFDASWFWETEDSEDAYWYLVNGANDAGGLAAADLIVTASISAPGSAAGDSLVGPFVVHTNQPVASVAASPAHPLTDSLGTPIDPDAVTDGQELYLDLRGVTAAGSTTITVTVPGVSGTGMILSVPSAGNDEATADDHAQTVILAALGTATTSESVQVQWAATGSSGGGTGGSGQELVATGMPSSWLPPAAAILLIVLGAALIGHRRFQH